MKHKLAIFFAISQFLLGTSQASASNQRPLLLAQLCLESEENFPAFLNLIKSIAQSNGMNFIDGSEQTRKSLESMGEIITQVKPTGPVVNINVESKDGLGVSVVNLGLPKNQFVLGFSEGTDPVEAHKFAEMVVTRLEKQWHVEIVPPNEGARGMKICKDKDETTSGDAKAR